MSLCSTSQSQTSQASAMALSTRPALYSRSSTPPTLAQHFTALSTHVVHIRCDIQREDMIVLPSRRFLKHPTAFETHSRLRQGDPRYVCDDRYVNNDSRPQLPFCLSRAGAMPGMMLLLLLLQASFEDICADVRGTADDPALKNIDLSQLKR